MSLLLDLFFPKKCINCRRFGEFLCADCFAKIRYDDSLVHGSPRDLDQAISVVTYNAIVKKLIYQLKYKPNLSELARTIGEIMNEGLAQNESFYHFIEQFKPVIVPVPLSPRRLRERGYNHAELLASYVAKYFNLKMDPGILIRIKETKPQFKLNKEARIKNLAGAFGIRENQKVPKSVVIIDDVATTYSTLKEAAKVLKRNGAQKVLGVTFAREL